MKPFIYQRISNFSMPKDIINYNKTSNPHLQQHFVKWTGITTFGKQSEKVLTFKKNITDWTTMLAIL